MLLISSVSFEKVTLFSADVVVVVVIVVVVNVVVVVVFACYYLFQMLSCSRFSNAKMVLVAQMQNLKKKKKTEYGDYFGIGVAGFPEGHPDNSGNF